MNNNDVLRRVRYTFDYSDDQIINIFAQADFKVRREQVCAWLKRDDDEEARRMDDRQLAAFLNGFINNEFD